jgi:hypothetical protein
LQGNAPNILSLFVELVTQILAELTSAPEARHSETQKENEPLIFKQLNLTLESSSIILARALNVIMHLLNIRHEVGQVGALHR